jgi:hypothetical protein
MNIKLYDEFNNFVRFLHAIELNLKYLTIQENLKVFEIFLHINSITSTPFLSKQSNDLQI